MEFEWDEEKAAANLAIPDVSFDEAKSVFDDPLYVDFHDPDHSFDASLYYHWRISAETFINRLVRRTR